VKQKECAYHYQSDAPRKRISIQSTSDYILFCIRRKSGAHELRRAASIDRGKEPRAKNAKNEEMHALREHRHLKETCKNRKVNYRFRCLSVVSRAKSGDER
jgi:hypothetical protein